MARASCESVLQGHQLAKLPDRVRACTPSAVMGRQVSGCVAGTPGRGPVLAARPGAPVSRPGKSLLQLCSTDCVAVVKALQGRVPYHDLLHQYLGQVTLLMQSNDAAVLFSALYFCGCVLYCCVAQHSLCCCIVVYCMVVGCIVLGILHCSGCVALLWVCCTALGALLWFAAYRCEW